MSLLSWNSLAILIVALATSTEASWLPKQQRLALVPTRLVAEVNNGWGLSAAEILRGGSTGEFVLAATATTITGEELCDSQT